MNYVALSKKSDCDLVKYLMNLTTIKDEDIIFIQHWIAQGLVSVYGNPGILIHRDALYHITKLTHKDFTDNGMFQKIFSGDESKRLLFSNPFGVNPAIYDTTTTKGIIAAYKKNISTLAKEHKQKNKPVPTKAKPEPWNRSHKQTVIGWLGGIILTATAIYFSIPPAGLQ